MLKYAGCIIVLVCAYLAGRAVNKQGLRNALVLRALSDWMLYVSDAMDFAGGTMICIVERSTSETRFHILSFIKKALEDACKGESLNTALVDRFLAYTSDENLSDADAAGTLRLLELLGNGSAMSQKQVLAQTAKTLLLSAERLDGRPECKRGYCETIAVAAAGVLLLIFL